MRSSNHLVNRWLRGVLVGSVLGLSLAGCSGEAPPDPASRPAPAAEPQRTPEKAPGLQFVDISAETGITLVTDSGGGPDKDHILEMLGSGVAVADYDGDGDLDVYVATAQKTAAWRAGAELRANALYRNNGDGTFTDVAPQAGVDLRAWSHGPYFVDYDNDGDKDLFVTAWGRNHLLRNEGDGRFTDVSRSSGLAGEDVWSTSAAFGDLDGDGDLDVYVGNYCEFDLAHPPFDGQRVLWKGIPVLPGPQGLTGQADALFRNNGDGTFTDVSQRSGIHSVEPLYALGVVFSDLDDDGDLDIYVANDSVDNTLWRNDGDLKFTEVGRVAGVSTNEDAREQAGMGTDAGDYDGDGRMDLFVTNFSHDMNTLYRNRGNLVFTDATFVARFRDSWDKLVWGAKFFDFDNDGWLDLFVANGHVYPSVDQHPRLSTNYRQTNSFYRNNGDGTFINASAQAGPGLAIEQSSRGLAVADLDRDGDGDLVLTNVDAPVTVLRNDGGNRRSWIGFQLQAVSSHRDAIGARLTVESAGRRWVREVNPFGSYMSQSDYAVLVGLGEATSVELTVRWPTGEVERFGPLEAGRYHTVTEGQGTTAGAAAAGS